MVVVVRSQTGQYLHTNYQSCASWADVHINNSASVNIDSLGFFRVGILFHYLFTQPTETQTDFKSFYTLPGIIDYGEMLFSVCIRSKEFMGLCNHSSVMY